MYAKFKYALFLSILFIFPQLTEAQIRYGAKAGVNISNLTLVNGVSKSRTGLNLGVLALIPLDNNDQFYIQPEILYSNEGEYLGGKNGVDKYKNYLNFIKVPILAKAYLSEAESEFFAELGPYFGFKVSDNIEGLDNPNGGQKFNSFDFGFSLGFGFSLNRQFEIGGRYSFGIVDMVKNDWENKSNHNSVLSFGLSYILY